MRSIWSIFRRRIGTFLAVLSLVVVLGVIITLRQTPIFIARSSVALKGAPPAAPPAMDERTPMPGNPTDQYVDTQVAMIRSDGMALKVANALAIESRQDIRVEAPDRLGQIARLLGQTEQAPRVRTAEERRTAAIDYVKHGLDVRRTGSTYALEISVESEDAAEATRLANEYARQYALADLGDQQAQTRDANTLIAQRLDQLRARALEETAAVQQYRIANNLLSTTGTSLTEQEISIYNQQVALARAAAAEDQARLATARSQLRSGSTGDDVGEALGSSVIGSLRTQQATIGARVADLTARYSALHPDVIRARSELESVNRQVAAEIDRVISNLAARAQVSQQRLGSLTSTLGQARGALAQNNRAMVDLKDLEQRAQTSQELYQSYLNRYKQLSAREGTEQPTATVLTNARLPRFPASPNRLLNIALALVLGTALGVAAAFARELYFAGITTGSDVTRKLHVRYLGLVPTVGSVTKANETPTSLIVADPRSFFAESFRSLRASIRFAAGHDAKVIAITSALPSEGKTATAICLARSIAMSGENTVLIDCDLRQQGVSRRLPDREGRPGLIEVLRGANTLDEALSKDFQTGLQVLPVSQGHDQSELLMGEEMDRLLALLRERFDAIIIDTAPVLPIADARLMLSKADASVFVVRWRSTPDHAVRAAFRQLPRERDSVTGVVLTRVDIKQLARFGLGDDASYYDRYKSYYG
ncbi:polysaccharide biosynthesis tyrosine autokinase [Sphingomonas radiodurans]|uniref:polysaccharide biosynthesis tyrosine autokinase n=1 Tax=Sphingomonas radiodurans TaxID=2890321 RepID=UPI001E32FDCA|nr:polysaccharide biosynthesis tyrosine autokinase [Sphingomonas radiodurans]WBH17097.1 polysaccharide biosynthesis tyrosine autokinase [Sphingomonas radiodurans]